MIQKEIKYQKLKQEFLNKFSRFIIMTITENLFLYILEI